MALIFASLPNNINLKQLFFVSVFRISTLQLHLQTNILGFFSLVFMEFHIEELYDQTSRETLEYML